MSYLKAVCHLLTAHALVVSLKPTRDLWIEWHCERPSVGKFIFILSLSWYLCWFFYWHFRKFSVAEVLFHPKLGCIQSTLCTRLDPEYLNTFSAYFGINVSWSNPNTLDMRSLRMDNCSDVFFIISSSVRRPLLVVYERKYKHIMYKSNINIRESYNWAEFSYISVIYIYIYTIITLCFLLRLSAFERGEIRKVK